MLLYGVAKHPSDETEAMSEAASPTENDHHRKVSRETGNDPATIEPALCQTEPGVSDSAPSLLHVGPDLPHPDWDRYELQVVLGSGGMGTVYRGRDRRLGRLVALKFIRGDNPVLLARFFQEAQAQARIDHPNLCRIYEVGHVEGKPYIAMQLVEGVPLDSLQDQLSIHEKVSIVCTAARALHEVHRLGIVHRDIKPSNIMVERLADGSLRPVVMDFGLAQDSSSGSRLTETGAVVGTPAFMSPEQARGDSRHLDRRADVYSLGATLYELFTGRPPFVSAQVVDVILAVLNDSPRPLLDLVPTLPAALNVITLKCLEKDPNQRYESALSLADDLQRHLDGTPIVGRLPSLRYRMRRVASRNRALVGLGVLAGLTILFLLGVGIRMELGSRRQAQLAQELGQDIKEMELFMRAAYSLPLHDIAREQAVVRMRMAQISDKLQRADSYAAGALRYALGRGHLVLREYPEAQAALEQAWDGGYKTQEAKLALGRTLGERYRQELEKAQRTGDRKWIDAQERELAERYLKRALQMLEGTASVIESPTYTAGLLAFYRKQSDVALALAQRAQVETPWLAEPIKLEGDVLQSIGIQLSDHGQSREGRASLVRARDRHRAASLLSRSDSSIYEAESVDWIRIMELDDEQSGPFAESLAGALASTDQALTATPKGPVGYQLRSWTYWRAGFAKLLRGQDPESDFTQSVSLASRSINMDPNDWQSYYYYALAVAGLADSTEAKGKSADALNQQAIDALTKSIKRNGNFAWSWNDLGLRQLRLFVNATQHGRPREKFFSDARAAFREALRIAPDYNNAHDNMVALYIEELTYLTQNGASITETLAAAQDSVRKAMAMKPDDPIACWGAVNIELIALEYAIASASELSPSSTLDGIAQQIDRCGKLNPEVVFLERNAAWLSWLRAQVDRQAGRDPQDSIKQGLRIVERGLKRQGESGDLSVMQARLNLLNGQTGPKVDAESELTRAVEAAEHSVVQAPGNGEASDLRCEALRVLASFCETERCNKQSQGTSGPIERGLQACRDSLAINPTRAMTLANHGSLLVLKAKRESSVIAKQGLASQAAQSVAKAIQINRLLSRTFSPVLLEAQRMERLPTSNTETP